MKTIELIYISTEENKEEYLYKPSEMRYKTEFVTEKMGRTDLLKMK